MHPGGFPSGVGAGAGDLLVAQQVPLLIAGTQARRSQQLAGWSPPLSSAHLSTQDF